jgi:hypothetical protein
MGDPVKDPEIEKRAYYTVTVLLQCPHCHDPLIMTEYAHGREYRHGSGGRNWCFDTNFIFGKFFTRDRAPGVLFEGVRGDV